MTTKIEDPRAKRERLASEGAKAMADYLAEAEAINERTTRLRAARLAREAAAAAVPQPAARPIVAKPALAAKPRARAFATKQTRAKRGASGAR